MSRWARKMDPLPLEEFCTLPTAAQPLRLMEFDGLFRRQTSPPHWIGPHRVQFDFVNAGGLYAQMSDLVARESACCSFLEFEIDQDSQPTDDGDRLVLRVGVPASRANVLEALLDRAVAALAEAEE